MDFNSLLHIQNLEQILKTNFVKYNVAVVGYKNIYKFLSQMELDINTHLEDEERIFWFKEKNESDNYSIYCFLYKDMEIIATISFSQYISIYEDTYEKLLDILKVSPLDSINGNTLIVNPKYRNQGIAYKLKQITNKYWFNYYEYIIGNTVNITAMNLYRRLGAIEVYSENHNGETYIYYYYKGSI